MRREKRKKTVQDEVDEPVANDLGKPAISVPKPDNTKIELHASTILPLANNFVLPNIIQRLQTGRGTLMDLRKSLAIPMGNYKPISVLSGHAFRAYTLCFDPQAKHVAAGGEDGRVCVYSVSGVGMSHGGSLTVSEISSRKGRSISNKMSIQRKSMVQYYDNLLLRAEHQHQPVHSKWISGLTYTDNDHVLSTSDTGDMCISALSLNDAGRFDIKPMSTVSLTPMGLYSLHYSRMSHEALTTSKDSSIRIVRLTASGLRETDCFENVHEGVTKSARWRDASVFASVGNDRCLIVTDRRDRKAKTVTIMSPHKSVVNSVGWRPFYEHQLFSAGFDPQIYMYDTRFAASPILTLDNHTPADVKRLSTIYRPIFYLGGRFLVTPTDKTTALFFYDATSGTLAHKCHTGAVYGTLDAPSVDSSLIAGCAATRIHVWQPELGPQGPAAPVSRSTQKKAKTSVTSQYF